MTFAQSTEVKIQKKDILTSKAWLEDSENPIKKLVHIFHKNGEYTIEGDKLIMNGKWLWSDKNELFVLFEGIKFDTLSHQFPQGLAKIPKHYYF